MENFYSLIANKKEEQPQNSNLWYLIANKAQHFPGAFGTGAGFYKNFEDMNNAGKIDGKDKYFHAKANFNAGQHRDILPAIAIDLLKEVYDVPNKTWINKNGYSFKENVNDSMEDLNADLYGLYQGITHPHGNPQIYLQDIRPNELDKRY